jgi:hypothetical protein
MRNSRVARRGDTITTGPNETALTPGATLERSRSVTRGVMPLAVMLSALHLLNFLNYTFLRFYINPPLLRSVLLVSFVLLLLPMATANIAFHLRRSWDMYTICGLALLSAAYSVDPLNTLKYASWLTLAVYLGTELSARIRTERDVVAALAVVFLPASFLVAIANLALGAQVAGGGRHFGALGSTHVDTAYAMNFICLFLALRALPTGAVMFPAWLKWACWGILLWSIYQAIFGLTRSVWLAVILACVLYFFRRRLSLARVGGVLAVAIVAAIVLQLAGVDRVVPDEVRHRLEVTEERVATGEIDPRLDGARFALAKSIEEPLGSGYAILSSHNSYLNILLYMGWPGFLLSLLAIARSFGMVLRMGLPWFMFFAIGAAPLLFQAFFEVQSLPGQANFIALLLWYALSRATIQVAEDRSQAAVPQRARRWTFVAP